MDMKILIELDEVTVRQLEAVAPARSRKRSEFIRDAIRRRLDQIVYAQIEEAYRRQPDADPVHFDPRVWDEWKPRAPVRRRRRK